MKRRIAAFVLATLIATPAFAVDAAPAPPPKKAGPDLTTEPELPALFAAAKAGAASAPMAGVAYRVFAIPGLGLKVHAWTFDQSRFQLRAVEQLQPKGSFVADLLSGGVFIINGGFFEREKETGILSSSGLLIVGGTELAPENDRAGSGIVYAGPKGVSIGYRKQLANRSAMRDAIQVGPVLVDPGGKVGVVNKQHDRHARSAICTRPGSFSAFVVEGGLSLFQFATLLAAPEADGGFACDIALNLDGGPSTQAIFSGPGGRVAIKGGWPVENALVISPVPE